MHTLTCWFLATCYEVCPADVLMPFLRKTSWHRRWEEGFSGPVEVLWASNFCFYTVSVRRCSRVSPGRPPPFQETEPQLSLCCCLTLAFRASQVPAPVQTRTLPSHKNSVFLGNIHVPQQSELSETWHHFNCLLCQQFSKLRDAVSSQESEGDCLRGTHSARLQPCHCKKKRKAWSSCKECSS